MFSSGTWNALAYCAESCKLRRKGSGDLGADEKVLFVLWGIYDESRQAKKEILHHDLWKTTPKIENKMIKNCCKNVFKACFMWKTCIYIYVCVCVCVCVCVVCYVSNCGNSPKTKQKSQIAKWSNWLKAEKSQQANMVK